MPQLHAPSLRPRPPGIEPSPAGLVSDTLPLSYRPTPDRVAQISGSDTTTEEVSYHGLGVNLQQFRENVSTLLLTESKVGFVSCYIAQSVLELRANCISDLVTADVNVCGGGVDLHDLGQHQPHQLEAALPAGAHRPGVGGLLSQVPVPGSHIIYII